jgi:hypothetical protein
MRVNGKALLLAAALVAVGGTMVASSATATHMRPQGATPFYTQLVPAYAQCQLTNTAHVGGLTGQACQIGGAGKGAPSSPNLCVGTPDGPCPAPAASVGYVRLCTATSAGGCSPVGDIKINSVITDVRCVPVPPAALPCASATDSGNGTQNTRDYAGQLQGAVTIRVSDHNNGSGTTSATVEDLQFLFPLTCAFVNTPVGSTCQTSTSFNAVVPGASVAGKRESTELGQMVVRDGGPDGVASTATNSDFMRSGIFVP